MKLIHWLSAQFFSKKIDDKHYIEYKTLIDPYKLQKGKAKTTISQFIKACSTPSSIWTERWLMCHWPATTIVPTSS